jgi:hypothetical protein
MVWAHNNTGSIIPNRSKGHTGRTAIFSQDEWKYEILAPRSNPKKNQNTKKPR